MCAAQTNEIASVVIPHIRKEAPDALMKSNAFVKFLVEEGKERFTGGTSLQQPVKLIANASSGAIAGTGGVISVNPSPQLQYMALQPKYYYFSVNFTLDDYTRTFEAEEEILNFMQTKRDMALADFVRTFSTDVQGSSSSNALLIEGLKDIVATSGTAYAGLTDTDYATGAYLPTIVTTSSMVVNYQNINYLIAASKARSQQWGDNITYDPDFGLWNKSVQAAFLNACQAQQRFYEEKILSAGFNGVKVNNVEFYMDDNTPGTQDGSTGDNYVYVFPKKSMKLLYKYGFDNPSPLDDDVRIPNQAIKSYQTFYAWNLMGILRRLISVGKTFVA